MLIDVADISDPRLAEYANMRDAELAQRADPLDARAHGGLFIAEGDLVVRRLIASRFRTRSVLLTPTRLDAMRADIERLPTETPVYVAPPPVLNGIVGFNMHRGLLAIGERAGAGERAVDELLTHDGPLIVLEDVNNHDNLGGVFRCAASLGGGGVGVVLSPRCADPLYRKALRVSIGCVLSVPFARSAAWPEDLERMRGMGWHVLAMTPAADAVDVGEAMAASRKAGAKIALLLGAEGPGLSAEAMRAATARVRIPMHRASPEVDSLNVHVAAGIGLYEVMRRA